MSTYSSTHVLWQSKEHDVSIVDIPHSITFAQGTPDGPCNDVLLSTAPQEKPYQTNEPKSAAVRAKLINNTVDAGLHSAYAKLLGESLDRVKSAYDKPWCLPRRFIETPAKTGNKRTLSIEAEHQNDDTRTDSDVNDAEVNGDHNGGLPSDLLSNLSKTSFTRVYGVDSDQTSYHDTEEAICKPQRNQKSTSKLPIAHPGIETASLAFLIPPMSSFVLGPCSDPQTLQRSVRAQAEELESPKTFDLILMDPPWPNRSVKRTHKTANSTYTTAPSLDDIYDLIMAMDLDILMSDSCLTAIWITNKPAVRELVLGEEGLFDCWGVELVEEWIWLKTTAYGEPVTPIDSVWRKPYEVLLLGRKRRQYMQFPSAGPVGPQTVKRRVLMSVPDLHSRKPCLKDLLEPLVQTSGEHRALEVFARHLVAGWWSWGDECIKFNWEGYWQSKTKVSGQNA